MQGHPTTGALWYMQSGAGEKGREMGESRIPEEAAQAVPSHKSHGGRVLGGASCGQQQLKPRETTGPGVSSSFVRKEFRCHVKDEDCKYRGAANQGVAATRV